MKKQFAEYMIQRDFNSAAELIFQNTLKVHVPKNVNLNINIDREMNIIDLANKMETIYNKINEGFTGLSFETLLANVFEKNEFSEKQNLKNNEALMKQVKSEYESMMNEFLVQQYEQFFEATTITLSSTLQSIVNASIRS